MPARAMALTASRKSAAPSSLTRSTPARLADEDHLVHRHLQRVRVPPEVDADGVADRDDVHPDPVDDPGDLVVPGDDADDLAAVALHLLQRRDGDLRVLGVHGTSSGWSSVRPATPRAARARRPRPRRRPAP